ncbi:MULTISPECIES: hypothetical protein [unclassified Nitrobacter]|uniref:hypothetical protein n=1 Tax=unclassified Nitrobacter TaxID=2620411 RepID=UPI000A796C1C|nr:MULTISPECIES: hypothetical protein [unclassified Nitrobacter]
MSEAAPITYSMSEPHPPILPPGFAVDRLVRLMQRAISATELDLSTMTVLTEAATGAYAVTPIIAAMANAKQVFALSRPSRYGSMVEVKTWIHQLAKAAGVSEKVNIVSNLSSDLLRQVDIVTNSGHLRPLTADLINCLPSSAVVALMFEAWEARSEDIDYAACARRGIPVVGINEQHEAVDVFSFLGPLCVKQLHDCGIPVYRNKIALICDNNFDKPILRGLSGQGASVRLFSDVGILNKDDWDAVVIALQPHRSPRIGLAEAQHLAAAMPRSAVLVQFWGDIDRDAAASSVLTVWPLQPPTSGHMAILLSEIGPEPIVRLQTGGLRAAEWVRRGLPVQPDGFSQLVGRG